MIRYKEITPEKTILNAREFLLKNDILCIEEWLEDIEGLCSVKITIIETSFFSNGKGLTKIFALASAYGELLERLQNMVYFRIKTRLYYDDKSDTEKHDKQYCIEKTNNWINKLNIINIDKFKLSQFICNSFFDYSSNVKYHKFYNTKPNNDYLELPCEVVDAYYGTNGMCAGNSKYEALVQGLSELLERYINAIIIKENITPPNVDNLLLNRYEYFNVIIRKIEETKQYKIELKDLSLGKGIPAIGLILYDIKRKSYFVKVAVHPCIEIAIERCLTELMQGKRIENYFGMKELGKNQLDATNYNNIYSIFVNGTGAYPYSLFSEDATYIATTKVNEYNSNEEMYLYLSEIIEKLGYEIYISDATFSPLYSYHIIIPGMSEILDVNNNVFVNQIVESRKFNNILKNIEHLDYEQAAFALTYLGKYTEEATVNSIINYNNFKKNNFYSKVKIIQLKILLNLFISEKKEALRLLRCYNKNNSVEYYKCFEHALALIVDKVTGKNTLNILSKFYNKNLIIEVLSDINGKQLKYFKSPKCYQCYQCDFKSECYYNNEMEVYKKIKLLKVNSVQ